jgi:hypothetical protein
MEKASDLDCGQVRSRVLGVTRGDSAPFFEAQERVLNQVTHFVQVAIILALVLAAFARGNDRRHALPGSRIQHRLGVVALVGDQKLRAQRADQRVSLRTIRSGTCCNNRSERIAMRIHGQMHLRVEPPFVRPMSWLPPTAPAAWR